MKGAAAGGLKEKNDYGMDARRSTAGCVVAGESSGLVEGERGEEEQEREGESNEKGGGGRERRGQEEGEKGESSTNQGRAAQLVTACSSPAHGRRAARLSMSSFIKKKGKGDNAEASGGGRRHWRKPE
jgi:hypothetical protein